MKERMKKRRGKRSLNHLAMHLRGYFEVNIDLKEGNKTTNGG
jgi:hypothetical protein